MLSEVLGQVRFAEDLDYDWASFIEHHFQIEGFALPNNPMLLDRHIALQSKRI